MKKKMKWIILGIIIAIVAVISIVMSNELKYLYNIEEVKEFNYVAVVHEGKYGIIDKKGNIIVEPIYLAIQIPNPSKPVFVCMSEYNQETKKSKIIVLNDKNEELFKEYENIQAISIETNIETTPYEKSTLKYEKDGKFGLINLDGKKITEPIYDEINSVHYKEGTFTVKQDEKMGVINLNGKVIIKPEYETITSDNYYNSKTKSKTTGFIVSNKTENGYRYGYVNYKGQVVLETQYTELERVVEIANENELYFIAFKEGQAGLLKGKEVILNYEYEDIQYSSLNDVFVVQRNSKQGIVSKTGATIVNTEYDSIVFGGMYVNAKKGNNLYLFDLNGVSVEKKNFISKTSTANQNYFIAIDLNDIYSIVDAEDKIIVDNNYSYIEYLFDDYFIVAKDGKNGIINISGEYIVDLEYTSIFKLNDTNILQAEKLSTKTIDLYSTTMHKIAGMDNATVTTYDNYIMLASENDFSYYDFSGNKLSSQQALKNNQLFAKKIGDKWGFVDENDNVVVEGKYEMVTDFNENGFAGIKLNGKWGVINQSNHEIIQEPIYNIKWIQPTFYGKYYRIRAWYGDIRYSDEIGEEK